MATLGCLWISTRLVLERCNVSRAVAHRKDHSPSSSSPFTMHVTATCSLPQSTWSHIQRDLTSVYSNGFRVDPVQFDVLLFPFS